ncbi:lysine exporter protein [Caldimonas brevitalea]|uniref:Lysine exporter protein n=2 Tax=Caldimonas brevitalea TaxID=413882 RepID=A0A0G3BPK8_9BURK|nr:lysine exporter protein [Caldimonas brevitalea]
MDLSDSHLAYWTTVLLATLIPGPSMMLALSHGMQHGLRSSVFSALGNMIASLLQGAAALFLIVQAHSVWSGAFAWLQLLGAVYLAYLGLVLMRSSPGAWRADAAGGAGLAARVSWFSLFRQGFAVAILNPKAILFFSSLFPQFVTPHRGLAASAGATLTPLALISLAGCLLYAGLGTQISHLFSGPRFAARFNFATGLLFGALALSGAAAAVSDLIRSTPPRPGASAVPG